MLIAGQLRVLARVAIEEPVGDEIGEAQDRRQAESPPPAEPDDGEGDQRHPDDVGELRRCVEDRRRGRALAAREPVAGRLGIGGEGGRLGDAEQHARAEDRRRSRRRRRPGRRDAPQERADPADVRHPEPVEHHADRHLKDGVGPEEGAEQKPEVAGRQVEFLLKLRGGDRDVHPVEVVDQDADAEQDADHPAAAAEAAMWACALLMRAPRGRSSLLSLFAPLVGQPSGRLVETPHGSGPRPQGADGNPPVCARKAAAAEFVEQTEAFILAKPFGFAGP